MSMQLSEFKEWLNSVVHPAFQLPDDSMVPSHYHITEIGLEDKQYIDCGGELRKESYVTFQIWTADDMDHRLTSEKLLGIIDIFEKKITDKDLPIIVEYQSPTVKVTSAILVGHIIP